MGYMAKLRAQLTFRVTEDDYDRLQQIADSERRKMNEVARALLERGVIAYQRDGKLFEPDEMTGEDKKAATITVPTIELTKKGAKKKNSA